MRNSSAPRAVIHLTLAVMGAAMLCVAYLRWIDHPITLWMSLQ